MTAKYICSSYSRIELYLNLDSLLFYLNLTHLTIAYLIIMDTSLIQYKTN